MPGGTDALGADWLLLPLHLHVPSNLSRAPAGAVSQVRETFRVIALIFLQLVGATQAAAVAGNTLEALLHKSKQNLFHFLTFFLCFSTISLFLDSNPGFIPVD